ncbi:MAG: ABC transporter substrate-binding protein [Inquilinaceae bacterium]
MKRPLIAAVPLAALLLGSSLASAQTKVPFWHSLANAGEEVILTLESRFEAQNPGIDIEPIYVGDYDDMIVRLQAAVVSGDVPTLTQLEITRYGLFAEAGALEPLDDRLAEEPGIMEDLRGFVKEVALYEGESYVLPFNSSTPVMYYNRDLFAAAGLDPEAPPATWDELLAAAKALTMRDADRTTQWGIAAPPQWVRWAMANQAGGGWMDGATNEVQMGMPETAAAYQFAADLVNVHKVAQLDGAIDEDVGRQSFVSGGTAITFGSTGSLGSISRGAEFDLGVAKLPCNVACAAPIGGATLAIMAAADEARKDAAWEFLKFVMTPESNAVMFTVTGYMPILHSTVDHPEAAAVLAENPHYRVAIDQLDVAFGRARPPAMSEIRALEPAVWESIVLQQKTAEEALAAFAGEMEQLMEDAGS